MYPDVLAQIDPDKIGDWMQFIIVAMVVAASAFGGISKVLIRKFGGGEEGQRRRRDTPKLSPPLRRGPVPPDPTASTPTLHRPRVPGRARPGEDAAAQRPPRPAPMARPVIESLPDVLADILPELVAARKPRPKPGPPDPQRATQPHRPKRQRPPQPDAAPSSSQARTGDADQFASGQRLRRIAPTLERLDTDVDDHVRKHIGDDSAAPTAADFTLDPIHSPTRESLRHAIVMAEVLGPPVSLRATGAGLWAD